MTSTFRFRLWLLIGGIVVVLLCRGFKALPGKSAAEPQPTKTEIKDDQSFVSQKESPPARP